MSFQGTYINFYVHFIDFISVIAILNRDYVGFIKKIMKLMQNDYPGIRKVEVQMTQLGQSSQSPPTAG